MIQLLLYCVLTTQGVEYPLCRAERWEPEIQRIEQALAKQPPKPGSIFFVGSSSFRLWDTAAAFGERPTVNVAFGGSRLQDCNYFYDRILKPYTPGRIVLYEGDNDLAAKFTPERTYQITRHS